MELESISGPVGDVCGHSDRSGPGYGSGADDQLRSPTRKVSGQPIRLG